MSRYCVRIEWKDCPHLPEAVQAELLAALPEHEREARSRGLPSFGEGLVYPVPIESIRIDPIVIPAHWPKAFAMDWNLRTGAVWGAWDLDNDKLVIYDEYYRENVEPSVHAAAIRAKGDWIRGVIDPSAQQKDPLSITRIIDTYRRLGLDLMPSKNAVDAGIFEIRDAMMEGRLKIFSTCNRLLDEIRLYRREKTKSGEVRIVKKKDELVDCLRYLWLSGRHRATVRPTGKRYSAPAESQGERGWMS